MGAIGLLLILACIIVVFVLFIEDVARWLSHDLQGRAESELGVHPSPRDDGERTKGTVI